MAKKSGSSAMVLRPAQFGGGSKAPTLTIVTPKAPAAPRKPAHKPKRHHAHAGGGDMTSTLLIPGMAGMILALIDKGTIPNVPTIPMLGRAGTLALGCWFMRKHSPKYLPKLAGGFAAIAMYEWRMQGSVSGGDGVAAMA